MTMFVDRNALISRGQTVSSSPAQVSARAAWRTVGISTTKRGRTSDLIQVDNTQLRETLDAMLEALGPAVAASINKHLVPVAQAAFEGWPGLPAPMGLVRTGLSKSLLALEIGISAEGDELTASLINRAPYALFIDRGAIVRELIWNPGRDAADPMADEIATRIAG